MHGLHVAWKESALAIARTSSTIRTDATSEAQRRYTIKSRRSRSHSQKLKLKRELLQVAQPPAPRLSMSQQRLSQKCHSQRPMLEL